MKEQTNKVTEIQIKYKHRIPTLQRPKIITSNDAELVFREILDKKLLTIKEEAAVLFLNRGNRVIGGYKISSGGITGTIIDLRLLLGIALKALACSIIIAHTHPSGELKASRADEELTRKLKEAAKLMDISLLD